MSFDNLNQHNTYNIIHLLSIRAAENIMPEFLGNAIIKFYPEKSSDIERCKQFIDHLKKEDRLLISDGYVYPVWEGGNSLELKKAYAKMFCKLCNSIGVATTFEITPFRI
jgi:hypothetical protein